MTKFQTSQALSILMSLALVVATWLPTLNTPAQNQAVISAPLS